MIKKIAMFALILLLIGVIGIMFTFESESKSKHISEKKLIQEDFDTIEIKADEPNIEMIPTNDSEAKIELSGKGSNDYLSTDVHESTLKVKTGYKQKKLFNFDFTEPSLTLKIYVPEKKYQSIQMDVDNGTINMNDIQSKNINIKTDNGRMELVHIKSDKIITQAENGRTRMKDVDATEVKTTADNGKIQMDGVKGKLLGRSNNGSISLITKHLDKNIDFSTDNGGINIQTEQKPTNAVLNATVDNGNIDVFGKSDEHYTFGNGKNLIKLDANNGSIKIKE